jgi:hypothetical protein
MTNFELGRLEPDIRRICDNMWIEFATRKHPFIGDRVVKNRGLGKTQLFKQSN